MGTKQGNQFVAGAGVRVILITVALVLCPALSAMAQFNIEPEATKGVGVEPHLGETLDLEIGFHDTRNNYVKLKEFFDGKKPVILSFNYSNCPKLCSVQLENMTLALREVDFTAGKDFEVISISIDPKESVSRARDTKARYTKLYNRPGSESGWHFLTGDQQDIEYITNLCGFKYKYIARQKLYSHSPVFILLSPEGKIVRYIHGLDYEPVTIERALTEAADGKIGSPINRLSYALGCFVFDESTGKYTAQVMGIMRLAGGLTVVLLLATLVPYWFFRRPRGETVENPRTLTSSPTTESMTP